MYVRDARGGMRPVLVDANQIPASDQYGKSSRYGGVTQKSVHRTPVQHSERSPSRQGGLLLTRRNRTPEIPTPSVFDTLPRGDIGGPPRFTEHTRSTSHLSLPQSNLSGSITNLKTASRSSSLRRRSGRIYSDEESPGRVEEIYRYRNRSGSGSRSRRRQRTPSGSRLHVYGSSASNSLRGSRTRLVDDNISIVSEPVVRNRISRPVSRGPTPGGGRTSVYSSGSAMYGSRGNLNNTRDPAMRTSQRSLNRSASRASLANDRNVYNRGRSPAPNQMYRDGRNSSMTNQTMRSSRQQLYTPTPGGEVTGVDPELKEAEKEGNQYFISMNLNAALTRPGFNGSMSNLDQIDRYSRNGSRMNLANGNDPYLDDDMNGYEGDIGFHKSSINVVDHDALIPIRPSSRSVSVMQLARDSDVNSLYGSRSVLSRSVIDNYITDGAMDDESYIVKSVRATRSRPTSRMSAYMGKSYERLNGDEKVEFDLELLGLNGGSKQTIVTSNVVNADQPRYVPSRQGATTINDFTWQETAGRRSANMFGPEPRFTMKLNDTLLMDYLPNEEQEVHEASFQGSETSDRRRRQSQKSDEDDQKLKEKFEELEAEKRRVQGEIEFEKIRIAREKAAIDREKQKAEDELRKAEAERRRLELERERRLLDEQEERRRQEKERERKRLEEEAEKERERRRKELEAEKDRQKQEQLRKMMEDLEREKQRLDQEREMERRRRQLELEREKERERKRQLEEEERAKQRKAEEEARRKRLAQEERDRMERQRLEELEREKRRQQEERERERRKREEEEKEKARKKREAEEREREKKKRELEERERERQKQEAEERERERRRQEEERERKKREEERRRKEEEDARQRAEQRRREEEAWKREMEKQRQEEEDRRRREAAEEAARKREEQLRKEEEDWQREMDKLRQQDEDRKSREAAEAKQREAQEKKERDRQLRSMKPADDEYVSVNRAQSLHLLPRDVDDHDFGETVTINRGEVGGRDETDGPDESWVRQRAMDFSRRLPATKETSAFVKRLMKDAPPNSVRQRVNVEREDEELKGPLPTHTEGLLNLDTVSEKVNMTLEDGWAELTVKVRCERIVPIKGAHDLYKKSSVIVSRIIDVDLTVTQERRDLYEQVMENRRDGNRLSNEDTFELYKAFMELAEAEEALGGGAPPVDQKIRIDKKVDEERFLDLQRERRAYGRPGDQDLVGLYEPGIASADFDTDDVSERRRMRSSKSPRTQHAKKYGRRSGASRRQTHDSDTSSLR